MDFKEQLKKQLNFLKASCNLYDSGNVAEAIRIATSLRIFFHDTGRAISLLTHLKSNNPLLVSTTIDTDAFFNITNIEIDLKTLSGHYLPLLDKAQRRHIPFKKWWDEELIYKGKANITRKDLILSAADKDGGTHVDKKLEPTYEGLLNGADSFMTISYGGYTIKVNLTDAHHAAIRQIGYEVLTSPGLIKLTV